MRCRNTQRAHNFLHEWATFAALQTWVATLTRHTPAVLERYYLRSRRGGVINESNCVTLKLVIRSDTIPGSTFISVYYVQNYIVKRWRHKCFTLVSVDNFTGYQILNGLLINYLHNNCTNSNTPAVVEANTRVQLRTSARRRHTKWLSDVAHCHWLSQYLGNSPFLPCMYGVGIFDIPSSTDLTTLKTCHAKLTQWTTLVNVMTFSLQTNVAINRLYSITQWRRVTLKTLSAWKSNS
jgi:hypothetical protein